jgi:hypothetical protein
MYALAQHIVLAKRGAECIEADKENQVPVRKPWDTMPST